MIGKTILHYKITEKLGEGGMGVVYLAEDTKLKRQVAIKFLPPQIAASEEERKRFKVEAQAAGKKMFELVERKLSINAKDAIALSRGTKRLL